MKTKILLAGAAIGLCLLPIGADEKEDVRTSIVPVPPRAVVPDSKSNQAVSGAPFVIPMPKDKSDFTVKPPEGAVIENPALDSSGKPRVKNQQPRSLLSGSGPQNFKKAPLSLILRTISSGHETKIIACFTPEKMREDPKVTMWLSGKTANEKLDKLKVLGLVWRKIGETYFVAWSETDLPPLQNAVPKK